MADDDEAPTGLVDPRQLKKGDYLIIKKNPCLLVDIVAKVRPLARG